MSRLRSCAVRQLVAWKLVEFGLAAIATAAALLVAAVVLPAGTPGAAVQAVAANCPQVEVVFARGRFESAGPGVLATRSSTRSVPKWADGAWVPTP